MAVGASASTTITATNAKRPTASRVPKSASIASAATADQGYREDPGH